MLIMARHAIESLRKMGFAPLLCYVQSVPEPYGCRKTDKAPVRLQCLKTISYPLRLDTINYLTEFI